MLVLSEKKPRRPVRTYGAIVERRVPPMSTLLKNSGSTRGAKYTMGESPCAGTCGRMTRSKHMKAAEHPGTVQRSGMGMCGKCYAPILAEQRKQTGVLRFPILKCVTPDCEAMTRSTAENPALAPNTRRRVSGGQCTECYKKNGKPADESAVRVVRTELDAFLAARRARVAKQSRRVAA